MWLFGKGVFLQRESHGEEGMEINTLPSSFLLLSLVNSNHKQKRKKPTDEIYPGQPPVACKRVWKVEWMWRAEQNILRSQGWYGRVKNGTTTVIM